METTTLIQGDTAPIKEQWSKPEITLLDLNQDTLGVNHHGPDTYGSSC